MKKSSPKLLSLSLSKYSKILFELSFLILGGGSLSILKISGSRGFFTVEVWNKGVGNSNLIF